MRFQLKFPKKLEDPDRPLLGPNVRLMKIWGMFLPGKSLRLYAYYTLHIILLMFPFTAFAEIWFLQDDINLVIDNLKMSLMSCVTTLKFVTFVCWQKHWVEIEKYMTRADKAYRTTVDAKKIKIIDYYTKCCRVTSYGYWIFSILTLSYMFGVPLKKFFFSSTYRMNVRNGNDTYLLIISSWSPMDRNSPSGYLVLSFYQIFSVFSSVGYALLYDTFCFCSMIFFRAELELLRIDCADICGTSTLPVPDEIALKRLKECHGRHVELVKYFHLLDSCMSPLMLFYMMICSVILCCTTIRLMANLSDTEKFMLIIYLIFGIAQLFLYCWYSNNVHYASMDLRYGPYESMWWTRETDFRKKIVLLMAQLETPILFTAGPFYNLTVDTFINILKGTYSYYTLLSGTQM